MDCAHCGAALPVGSTSCPRCATMTQAVPVAVAGASLAPGQRFASRYTVIRLLGAGGMGEVYQAWDESLGAAVALKVIRPDTGAIPAERALIEERFKRELRLARQITHINVVRIHDLGEADGAKYLTMEYVRGSDLASLLRQPGGLPLARVLSLARQIAAGLAAVHKAGVIHRDLKPANVLIDEDDRALLTDFGIARPIDAATLHTLPGSIVGTLDYMAPEQARGQTVDQRSDIYAFGLVLYDLLLGGRPRTTNSGGIADVLARIEHGPPSMRSVNPAVPPDVERIVSRCLEADPAKRYQRAGDLLADLERLSPEGRARISGPSGVRSAVRVAAAVVIGVLLAVAGWWAAQRRAAPVVTAGHAPVSVLIADFTNRAGDSVFDGALEQALSIAIEGAPFITAYPRADALKLSQQLGSGGRLDEAAARLVAFREGIGVVLAGSVEPRGAGYHLSVSAIRPDPLKPERSTPLAAAGADAATKGNVLQAVDRMAETLRRALGDTTIDEALAHETISSSSLEAVRAYAIAQRLSTDRKNDDAIRSYREAIGYDPQFGRAYAGWAAAAFDLGRREEAAQLWNKALSLMDRMTEREKYRTLGAYYIGVAHNYSKAIESYTRLVEQYPADLAGHNNLALAYFYTRRFGDALAEGRRAIEVSPRSLKFRGNYSLYAMYAGDFATAVASAKPVLQEDPTYSAAYLPMAMNAMAEGDVAAAEAFYRTVSSKGTGGASLGSIGLADLRLYEGRGAEAVQMLPAAIAADRRTGNTAGAAVKTIALAEAYGAAGRLPLARQTVDEALALSHDDSVAVPAGLILIQQGDHTAAERLARDLGNRLPSTSRAYGRLLDAEIALSRGGAAEAITSLTDAAKLADVWLVRFALGRAYFAAGPEHLAEALSEFELVVRRRGEATALFLDDLPTYRYMAPVSYWLARTQEALGMRASARDNYGQYVKVRARADRDPLREDARQRLAR